SVGEINADGWPDVFITSGMNFPYRYSVNNLLLNAGGKHFLPSEFTLGIEPRDSGSVEWFRLDCAGPDRNNRMCLQCGQPDAASVGCRGGPVRFTVVASQASRSSVMLDLDGDGDLDIVTNE